MATCIAAYGADVTIKNTLKFPKVTVDNWLTAEKPADLQAEATVTNRSVVGEASWVSKAMLGVAIASEVMAHKLAYDEYRLAKREADLAQDVWDRFRSTYMPVEARLAAYFRVRMPMAIAESKLRGDYQQYLDGAWATAEAQFDRYRTCPTTDYGRNIAWHTAMVSTDVKNLGKDTERNRDREAWATWFNRRATFLNLGQNILSNTSEYIKASMGLSATNRNTFMDIAQGAGYMSGYRNMEQTLKNRRQETGVKQTGADIAQSTEVKFNDYEGAPDVVHAYGMDAGYKSLEFSVNDRAQIEISIPTTGEFR